VKTFKIACNTTLFISHEEMLWK